MMLVSSNLYQKDLLNSFASIPTVEGLRNRSILVTGATGLIGSTVVDLLLLLNKEKNLGMTIYCCARSIKNLENRFGLEHPNVEFVQYDASNPIDFEFNSDYIIHAASPASPDLYVNQPVETMASNFLGMYHLLEYARERKAAKVLYVSSSEVYGTGVQKEPIKEDFIGKIDHLNVRSSYSSSKRSTETLCVSFASEYGLNVSIARPGHIYGPSAKATDNRVSSLFMTKALNSENIVMKSTGSQLRSYCYSVDCASAIIAILLSGNSGEAYNVSNPKSIITIKTMAEEIASVANVNLVFDLPSKQDKIQENPMDNASLNSERLLDLDWVPLFDAKSGFSHTYRILKEIQND